MSAEHGELTITDVNPPLHQCGTHGVHPRWITFYGYGDPPPLYCMDCIVAFLDAQSIGKAYDSGEHQL